MKSRKLVYITKDKWPYIPGELIELWKSRDFVVQIYAQAGGERISISRTVEKRPGVWEDGISWDEIQGLKEQCGRGDKLAIEIYPADKNVVNVANMRHIWVLPDLQDIATRGVRI